MLGPLPSSRFLLAADLKCNVDFIHRKSFEGGDDVEQDAYTNSMALAAARMRMWACVQKVIPACLLGGAPKGGGLRAVPF